PPWSKVTSRRVTVPSKTLETNSCAKEPWSLMASPQGPLMSLCIPRFPTTWPLGSSTNSPPDWAVSEVPLVVNTEPAKTSPARTRPRALVNPIGGGPPQDRPVFPLRGSMVMIVLPRPWKVVSLKFEISISPGFKPPPPDGKSGGTNARPYGFRSPLDGTVETWRGRNGFKNWASAWTGRPATSRARSVPVTASNVALGWAADDGPKPRALPRECCERFVVARMTLVLLEVYRPRRSHGAPSIL